MIQQKDFDTSVRPQDDFNQYVNGGWAKENPIPETESRWGSFQVLGHQNAERAYEILKQLLAEPVFPEGSLESKLQKYVAAAYDPAGPEKTGISFLKDWQIKIAAVDTVEGLWHIIRELQSWGVPIAFHLYTDFDDKDSTKYALRFAQGGLGLPDKDYYFKDDPALQKVREEYPRHIAKMFSLVGVGDAERIAQSVWQVELQLAKASMTATERRDIEKLYNKVSIDELETQYPFVGLRALCESLAVPVPSVVFVDQLHFFSVLHELWHSVPVGVWKDYVLWHVSRQLFSYMGERVEEANFSFYGTVLSGAPAMQPRWKRIVRWVSADLGEALGQKFVEKYFPPEAKARMLVMVQDLKEAFAGRVQKLAWMSEQTKQVALEKLERVTIKVGYPDKWIDYSELEVTAESFVQNGLNANRFELRRQLRKLVGPIDHAEWHMVPHIVNAYAHYNLMEVVFPAGILQYPFFDFAADDAENYGAIGAVIGHELTHHFDDKGGKFDVEGNMNDWWSEADKKQFEERAEVLREQANKVEILPGLMLNGQLTLGENIADLGGIEIALDALERSLVRTPLGDIEGLTPHQRFFISFCRSENSLARDEYLRNLVLSDPHSPSVFRTNGVVRNVDRFCDAFQVAEGDKLYLPLEERVKIW
ncbi:MAG: M13 family metallopeptidase [Candidatus Doudnabacteria bacterium]|nr:M13 family metallopeptidase [Candidatus Doudnabacteria bacterium]